MLDLRQLRYFVAVAEREHIGQAAQALHISQSPLSRQILQLEAQLGLTLFERVRQRLYLTAAGRDFLAEARALQAQAEVMEARARRIGRGEGGELIVGYVEGAIHSGLLPDALRRFRATQPATRVALRPLRSAPQLNALRNREIDCGIVYTPPGADDPDLFSQCISDEPMLLALPLDHPLASAKQITPRDLDGQGWIALARHINPAARDRFLATCRQAGFTPDIHTEANDPATFLALVACGQGLALVQASMRRHPQAKQVVLVALPWLAMNVTMHLVHRRSDTNRLVRDWRSTLLGSVSPASIETRTPPTPAA